MFIHKRRNRPRQTARAKTQGQIRRPLSGPEKRPPSPGQRYKRRGTETRASLSERNCPKEKRRQIPQQAGGDIGDSRCGKDHQHSQRQFPLRPGLHGAHILSKDGAFLHCIKGSQTCQEKNGPRRTLSTGGRFQSISLYISL